MTMNVDWQSIFALNASLATGRITIATISQKVGYKKNSRNGKVPCSTTPSQTNQQGTCGLGAQRTQSINGSWPLKARWALTTPPWTIATLAMMIAAQWTPLTWKPQTTKTEALVAACSAMTMTTLPPFWLLLSLHERKIEERNVERREKLPKKEKDHCGLQL